MTPAPGLLRAVRNYEPILAPSMRRAEEGLGTAADFKGVVGPDNRLARYFNAVLTMTYPSFSVSQIQAQIPPPFMRAGEKAGLFPASGFTGLLSMVFRRFTAQPGGIPLTFPPEKQNRVAVSFEGIDLKIHGIDEGPVQWGNAATQEVVVDPSAEDLIFSYDHVTGMEGLYFIKMEVGERDEYVLFDTDRTMGERLNLSETLRSMGYKDAPVGARLMIGLLNTDADASTPAGARAVFMNARLEKKPRKEAAPAAPQAPQVRKDNVPLAYLKDRSFRIRIEQKGADVRLEGLNEGNIRWGHGSSEAFATDTGKETLMLKYDGVSGVAGQYFIKIETMDQTQYILSDTDKTAGAEYNLTHILQRMGWNGFVSSVRVMLGVINSGGANRTPLGARATLKDLRIERETREQEQTESAGGRALQRAPHASLTAGGVRSVAQARAIRSKAGDYVRREGPKIIPHSVHWYGTYGHWDFYGHNPARNPEDIAAVEHPLIGLYNSSDQDYNRWMVQSAKAMGMDGLNIDYYAGTVPEDQSLPVLFKVAEEEKGFTIALMYETRVARSPQGRPDFNLLKQHIRNILEKYAVSPAYQRIGGVPVIYMFGMVSSGFTAEDFARVAVELEAEGMVFILVGDTTTRPEYYGIASGFCEWVNMGAFLDAPEGPMWRSQVNIWEEYARESLYQYMEGRRDIFGIASVYKGFDDSKLGGGNWGQGRARVLSSRGGNEFDPGAVFRETVEYAVENQGKLPWVLPMTWDDWNEGTNLEPSLEKGFSGFFGLMRLAARYKGTEPNPSHVIALAQAYILKKNGSIPPKVKPVIDRAKKYEEQLKGEVRLLARRFHEKEFGFAGKGVSIAEKLFGLKDKLKK